MSKLSTMSDNPVLHDPVEFYRATLANEGITPEPVDMAKFAEANKIALPVAELAKRYYEQLQLDGVKYASEDQRLADAIAIASSYYEQVETAVKTANAVADEAVQKLAAAAEEIIKAKGLDITPYDLIKVAAEQTKSIEEFDTIEAEKTAALGAQVKTAAGLQGMFLGGEVAPHNVLPGAHEQFAQLATGGQTFKGKDAADFAMRQLGATDEADLANKYVQLHQHLAAGKPGTEAIGMVRQPPSWWSANKNWAGPTAVAGGIVGLGALLYAHHQRQKQKRQMENMMLQRALAQANPEAR